MIQKYLIVGLFFILLSLFITIEYDIIGDIGIHYNINQSKQDIELYIYPTNETCYQTSEDLEKTLDILDSIYTIMADKWMVYQYRDNIKNRHNKHIHKDYVRLMKRINFNKLLIHGELNKRNFYNVRDNVVLPKK